MWVRADEVLARMGEELAFVEPGRDTGLLPINSLVMELEELPREGVPAMFGQGLAAVRSLLDRLLDGPGTFSAESIGYLNEWHPWMVSVVDACEEGRELPDEPLGWHPSAEPATTALAEAAGGARQVFTATDEGDEPAIVLNLAEDAELLREFHSESLELLHSIEQGVLQLEETPEEAGTIHSIFRAFHTFKGGAGLLRLGALRDLAHDLESLLDAARRSELRVDSEVIEIILAGGDTLKQFTRAIGDQLQGIDPGNPIIVPTRSLRQRVQSALREGPATDSIAAQPPSS